MTKQELIEENMGLVHFVIKTYYPWHIGDEDIIQIGMVGLCVAADKWDSEKGTFGTYATRRIRGAIAYEFRKRKKQIKTISLDAVYGDGNDDCELKDIIVGEPDVDYVDVHYLYDKLTPLQQQIFDLKAIGLKNCEIARELKFSKEYIGQQVRHIKLKYKKYMGNC